MDLELDEFVYEYGSKYWSEFKLLKRKAAAFDWLAERKYYITQRVDRYVVRFDCFDIDSNGGKTPLEAVEAAMKREKEE